jgi:hypothetical protein
MNSKVSILPKTERLMAVAGLAPDNHISVFGRFLPFAIFLGIKIQQKNPRII